MSSVTGDPWTHLQALTPARIAQGRAGGSQRTRELLAFTAAHAAARDAVWSALDVRGTAKALEGLGLPVLALHSLATDRSTYLRRPDLGRLLSEKSAARLRSVTPGYDVVLILGDGLSAVAAEHHGPALVEALASRLRQAGMTVGPLCLVSQARVAVADEVGHALGAKVAVIALGERPGLGSADSLGIYLVHGPRRGRTDAERNCVSNVRPDGMNLGAAAEIVTWLVSESLRRNISGVSLKDERGLVHAPDIPRQIDAP